MSVISAFATLNETSKTCTQCGLCTTRCEVLKDSPFHSVGELAGVIARIAWDYDLNDSCQVSEALRVVCETVQGSEGFVYAVRRCCLCSFCTAQCPVHIHAATAFLAVRELLFLAGIITTAGFESTQVDKEWHIFSVYRAVYGIGYSDFPHLENAHACGADTLFFPGCSLVSYAPELTRAIFDDLNDRGFKTVIYEGCCGSPLKSAGLTERSAALRRSLLEEALAAGIKRIVFACPGCREELREITAANGPELVALPQLLAQAARRLDAAGLAHALKHTPQAIRSGGDEGYRACAEGRIKIAFFDSCHDRSCEFARPLRAMVDGIPTVELAHAGKDALCCGAGGAASLVDPDICDRRIVRIVDEAKDAGADVIVTDCPTCSYSLAAYFLTHKETHPAMLNYLEVIYGIPFDWESVFLQLESMWTGEYGAWVCQQLL